jgi:hypothetical protein
MNRLKSTIEKMGKMNSTSTPAPPSPPPPPVQPKPEVVSSPNSSSKFYLKLHKGGPELLVTKILMINGPLTSKEIWRIFERMQAEAK